jgi:predicted enzyme related to lactoylglutathione lyase
MEARMADNGERGRFVWYDLMTKDQEKAKGFYTKVFGWGTETWNGPMPYTMWTVAKTPVGGLMAMPPNAAGAPPHWLAYIAVPDVDATVRDAETRGGKTHVKPTDIPTVGRFAVLMDPQGAAFAVFKSSNPAGPDAPPKTGEFSWHELATTDVVAAFRFYEALFGWEKRADHDMGPGGLYRLFGRKGREIGGMFKKPPEMPAPPNWLQYVMVDGATATVDRVKGNGGQVLNGPMEVPGGDWIAQCLDPQGAAFAIHSKAK